MSKGVEINLFVYIAEDRQDQNAKRRKLERDMGSAGAPVPSAALGITGPPPLTGSNPLHPSLPAKPGFAASADALGFGEAPAAESVPPPATAAQAWGGSNRDIVANRRAIRMANMSAAEVLKAELSGKSVEPPSEEPPSSFATPDDPMSGDSAAPMEDDFPGLGAPMNGNATPTEVPKPEDIEIVIPLDAPESSAGVDTIMETLTSDIPATENGGDALTGAKRTFDEGPGAADATEVEVLPDDDEPPPDLGLPSFKKNADGTVDQEDTVRWEDLDPEALYDLIWCNSPGYIRFFEPGYKERYYRQKFGMEPSDVDGRNK